MRYHGHGLSQKISKMIQFIHGKQDSKTVFKLHFLQTRSEVELFIFKYCLVFEYSQYQQKLTNMNQTNIFMETSVLGPSKNGQGPIDCNKNENNQGKGTNSYKEMMAKQTKKDQKPEEDYRERIERERVQEFGWKCGKTELTKKQIIGIFIGVILLISVTVIPIAVVFSRQEKNQDHNSSQYKISHNGRQVDLRTTIVTSDKNPEEYRVITAIGKKTTAIEPLTGVTLRCKDAQKTQDSQCHITVPILSLLSSSVLEGLETKDWLAEYNRNPRTFIDKFYTFLRQIIQKHNPEDKEQLTILEIQERIMIDIKYNSQTKSFEVLKFDPDQQEKIPVISSEAKDDAWVKKFLEDASKKLKSVVLGNLELIKSHSEKIIKEQENFTKDEQLNGDWEDALINRCRTVSHDTFRCSLNAVEKLVTGFQAQKIHPDAVLTYAFVITVHDHSKLIK